MRSPTTEYRIEVEGCDGSTVITMALTSVQAATVRAVAEAITAGSGYGCEPRMKFQVAPEVHDGA